jgi:hypothetical protein
MHSVSLIGEESGGYFEIISMVLRRNAYFSTKTQINAHGRPFILSPLETIRCLAVSRELLQSSVGDIAPRRWSASAHVIDQNQAKLHDSSWRLSPLFRITAFNASRSRLRSATSCFNRRFSSCTWRMRCASPASNPPNFALHP